MELRSHRFLDEFQPIQVFKQTGIFGHLVTSIINYGAVFALAYIVGRGLKMGLGI